MKYYFYNPKTGCGWEEEITYIKKKRFLEHRPWIRELKGIFMAGMYNQTYFDNNQQWPVSIQANPWPRYNVF